jgi:hypothetical protein
MNHDGKRTTGGARADWKDNNPIYRKKAAVGLGEKELDQNHVRSVIVRISGI